MLWNISTFLDKKSNSKLQKWTTFWYNYFELKINGVDFFFSHGHKYNIDNVPPVGEVVVYGHFHTGFIKEEYGVIFANPGSISLPKNNTKHSYMIIDDQELILKDVEGNIIDRQNYVK